MAKIKTTYINKINIGDFISLKEENSWSELYEIRHIDQNIYFFGKNRSMTDVALRGRLQNGILKIIKKEKI